MYEVRIEQVALELVVQSERNNLHAEDIVGARAVDSASHRELPIPCHIDKVSSRAAANSFPTWRHLSA